MRPLLQPLPRSPRAEATHLRVFYATCSIHASPDPGGSGVAGGARCGSCSVVGRTPTAKRALAGPHAPRPAARAGGPRPRLASRSGRRVISLGCCTRAAAADWCDLRARAGATSNKTANTLSGKGKTELVPMTEETMKAKQKHDEMLRKFHIEMRARTIAAPTNDMDVKLQLRRFLEPICLFGEGPAERRDRLKNILARMEVEQGISANEVVAASAKEEMDLQRSKQEAHDANEVFYTEGTEELKAARIWIMDYSLPRSSRRVRDAKRKQVCQR
jgi:hypothetical protein